MEETTRAKYVRVPYVPEITEEDLEIYGTHVSEDIQDACWGATFEDPLDPKRIQDALEAVLEDFPGESIEQIREKYLLAFPEVETEETKVERAKAKKWFNTGVARRTLIEKRRCFCCQVMEHNFDVLQSSSADVFFCPFCGTELTEAMIEVCF